MNPRLVGLSLAAVLIIAAAGTGLASGGSAYVTSGCSYEKSLQDNTIWSGDEVFVWVKVTGSGTPPYTWTAVNNQNGETYTAVGNLDPDGCGTFGPKYILYDTDWYPTDLGSWTLTVWDSTGASVSSDSFRVIPN